MNDAAKNNGENRIIDDSSEPEKFDSEAFLNSLTSKPGVYRMINQADKVIYVGKAKNLKKRVTSYFNASDKSPKTRVMVSHIARIETTVTHTENEALILESNLIKSLKPQYNITYRDDKSYPHIYLSADKDYPRLSYFRGMKKAKGRYFGPYPSAGAVRESLNLLQKIFLVRQCEDSFYNNRSRPCLQFQIKRCSAPCVEAISVDDYQSDVRHAVMFLEGKNSSVIDELVKKMEQASADLDFEKAVVYRDQIAALRKVQEKQYITADGESDLDVIVGVIRGGTGSVQVFNVRGGMNLGNKSYFPKLSEHTTVEEMLAAFVAQYYIGKSGSRILPTEILLNEAPADLEWLENVLSEQAGKKVKLSTKLRGERSRWVQLAVANANTALDAHLAGKENILGRFELLQEVLGLDAIPQRIECFDISHTMGEATVASCVVCDQNGPLKSDYRRFNIEGITPGDDYAAMLQALTRRYRRLKEGEGKMPDVLLIDGGKNQMAQAEKVFEELQISGITLLGVAKGPDRRAGLEVLHLSGNDTPLRLKANSPALHLIQLVRDESHRFAIAGHRAKRGKARNKSPLEEIPGLGPKRRQQLLKQFGGLQGVSSAGIEDLANVKGISKELAEKIYGVFHAQ